MRSLQIWWRGAGAGGWIGSVLAILAMSLFALFRPASDEWVEHGSRELGDLSIQVSSRGPVVPGEPINLRINSSTGSDSAAQVFLGVNDTSTLLTLSAEQQIELLLPPGTGPLELHMRRNGQHVRWYLGRPI